MTRLCQWTWAEVTKLLSSRRLKRFQSYHKLSWFLSSGLGTGMSFIKGLLRPVSWSRPWSGVASAFSSLTQGLGSPARDRGCIMPARVLNLTTRRVVNDKALALWLCRKELPPIWKELPPVWKEVKQVKCLLGGKIVCVNRHRQTKSQAFVVI